MILSFLMSVVTSMMHALHAMRLHAICACEIRFTFILICQFVVYNDETYDDELYTYLLSVVIVV